MRIVKRNRGFTLIELLTVVAIIGIIAAILIPNLLDALQKAKQKRTVADMKLAGTAWFAWLTDQFGAAAAGATQEQFAWSSLQVQNYDVLFSVLVPLYAQSVPREDGWKNEFEFGLSNDLSAPIPLAIRSRGGDGLFMGNTYTVGAFISTDYFQDIVWAGGYFVRWPTGLE